MLSVILHFAPDQPAKEEEVGWSSRLSTHGLKKKAARILKTCQNMSKPFCHSDIF